MSVPTPNLQNKLVSAVKADPAKSLVLGVLGAVLLALGGRLALSGNGAPRSAAASLSEPAGKVAAAELASATPRKQGPTAALREWCAQPVNPLGRNIFLTQLEYYPSDGGRSTARAELGSGFWDQLAKSMSSRADQRKERQVLIENLQIEAGRMKLQTILMGPKPKAIINGGLVAEGDVVESFRVVKIESRRIIVERQGVKLEIQMN